MCERRLSKRENASTRKRESAFKDYLIPDYILKGEGIPESRPPAPRCPIIIFINENSGGKQGAPMLKQLQSLPNQVFDLPKGKQQYPTEVLQRILWNLDKLISEGDDVARSIRDKLRILVAGGDGTHGWLLATVADLNEPKLLPVATVPLGTGNNLPYSFGWGKKNPGTDISSIQKILQKVMEAKPMPVDRWRVVISMSKPVEDSPLKSEVALEKVPSFEKVQLSESLKAVNTANVQEDRLSYLGSFWNYFSIGMDAEVSYAFHTARNNHPERFKNQLWNQTQYACISCLQGWFCVSCFHTRSRNINSLARIFFAKHDDDVWQELKISPRIRSIVLLNLPSFSGGLDPWGNPGHKKCGKRGLTPTYVNDGLLEVVGFRDGWHGLTLLLPNGHGARLAQAHKVKIKFKHGKLDKTYMRVDGEPWVQPLPASDDATEVEISKNGQAMVLTTAKCLVKTAKS